MADHKTLLEFLMDLLNNKDSMAAFHDNPHAALQAAGLGNVCVDDIKTLLPVVLEKVDPQKCAQYEDDCDADKCWDAEPKHHDGDHHHHKPIDCDDEGRPAPHTSEIDKVVTHLNYVTNNYSYDSHDTVYNTNNVTKIWAGDGSNVHVNNETNNVGSHGVLVKGDNNAPIASGDHAIVGSGNQVSGDGSHTAFGNGVVADGLHAGDGSAIAFGAPATSTNAFGHDNLVAAPGGTVTNSPTDTTLNNHGGTAAINGAATDSHNPITIKDSGNSDTHTTTDSHNHTDTKMVDDHSTTLDHATQDNSGLHLPGL